MRATMITAAMATMATVETAKTTRPFCLVVPMSKLAGLLLLRAPPPCPHRSAAYRTGRTGAADPAHHAERNSPHTDRTSSPLFPA